jgi:hypothetical protein
MITVQGSSGTRPKIDRLVLLYRDSDRRLLSPLIPIWDIRLIGRRQGHKGSAMPPSSYYPRSYIISHIALRLTVRLSYSLDSESHVAFDKENLILKPISTRLIIGMVYTDKAELNIKPLHIWSQLSPS